MVKRRTSAKGRVAIGLLMASVLATSAACGGQQEQKHNALQDTSPKEASARVVSGPISDGLHEDAEDAEDEDEAVTEERSEDFDDRDRLDAAIEAAVKGDTERAQRDLERLKDHEELGSYALYNLGVIAFSKGETERAEGYIRDAIERDASFGPGAVAMVRRLLAEDAVDEAKSFVRTQLDASDNASGVRAAALLIPLHEGNYERVIQDTRSILVDEPTNLDAHYALSMAYLGLGRVELADYILREALKRDEGRADVHFGLGKIAWSEGNEDEAERRWKNALKINPHYPEAVVALSVLDLKAMEYERVVEALEPLVKDLPDYVDAWINYGSGLKGTGKAEEAKKAFERALALDEDSADASFNMGILYLDVDQFEDLEQKERMETALTWFETYRKRAGTLADDDPVASYEQFARQEIEMQEELERQAKEEEERKRRREEEKAQEGSDDEDDGWDDDWDDDDGDSDDDDDWGDDDWDDDW